MSKGPGTYWTQLENILSIKSNLQPTPNTSDDAIKKTQLLTGHCTVLQPAPHAGITSILTSFCP